MEQAAGNQGLHVAVPHYTTAVKPPFSLWHFQGQELALVEVSLPEHVEKPDRASPPRAALGGATSRIRHVSGSVSSNNLAGEAPQNLEQGGAARRKSVAFI